MNLKLPVAPVAILLAALLASAAAAQPTRFLAFGDSVTEAVSFDETCACEEHACRQECGYPWRLEAGLNAAGLDAVVVNEGLGGERTNQGITRIDEVLDTAEEPFDVMLLMEGTNDISREISPESTTRNLREMARKAARRGIETVHATLVPRYPRAELDAENVLNADMAGRIRDLAFSSDKRIVDPFEVFISRDQLFETFYNSDRPSDPVGHPNAQGFSLLATTFFDVLAERADTVPPVVGRTEPGPGAEGVPPFTPVVVRLYDFGSGLQRALSVLRINGEAVAVETRGGDIWQDLVYQPAEPLPAEVTVGVEGRDRAGNALNREVARFTVDTETFGPCASDATTLCIDRQSGDGRFRVTLHWQTALNGGQEGDALALPLAPIGLRRGGLFSFFDVDNPEVLVKVLDGCSINGFFWVFVAPTTTLGYELRIVDTLAALSGLPPSATELVVTNPDGRDARPVSQTSAFATCDL